MNAFGSTENHKQTSERMSASVARINADLQCPKPAVHFHAASFHSPCSAALQSGPVNRINLSMSADVLNASICRKKLQIASRFIVAGLLCCAAAAAQPSPRLSAHLNHVDSLVKKGPFTPDWNSLAHWQTPDWFRDAKFGIFIHWGVYSVPAFANEWYPRNMYLQGNPAWQHQIATWGPESKFGYKDFIPMFTASRFDPTAWVDLFRRAGARYVVPVAEHCDGFAMYDSDLTTWDAARMGPRRDVVGEIARAARAAGLHFGASSHRAEHWWWYDGGTQFDSDVRDPKYAGLYGPAQSQNLPGVTSSGEPDPNHLERWLPPDRAFLDDWLGRTTEIVDKYHPELLYLDWWIGQPAFQPYLKRLAAYYYDDAAARKAGVVLTYKEHAFPENAALLDIERGKMDQLRLLPWQTDTSVSIHSWGYVENDSYRDARSLIDELVDVVSKNGNLLLNVGPRSDGTIPEQARDVLLAMGSWLRTNGEAIYGTRPWLLFGEGPTSDTNSAKLGSDVKNFTAEDIRFTRKGDTLYAIALGWPDSHQLLVRTLFRQTPYLSGPVTAVALLGSDSSLHWQQTATGLLIDLPQSKPNDIAYVFRIRTGHSGQIAKEAEP
jgi:alpha-L-fucosidase